MQHVPSSKISDHYAAARSVLRNADPVLGRLIDEHPDFDPRAWLAELPKMDAFGALLFQIVGQQLSVSSTRAIVTRLQALFGGHLSTPHKFLDVDPDKVHGAGLSSLR